MPQEHVLPSGGPLRVLVHGSLAQAEPGWRALQVAGTCYGFQTFEWLSAWQELLGEPDGVRPAVVEVRSGPMDTPVMVVPLGLYPKPGLKILSFLGGRVTDYHAPLLDPAFARSVTPDAFAALWRDILSALPKADYIHFWRMPEHVEDLPNPFVLLKGARPDERGYYSRLPRTYAEYEQRQGQSFTRKSRRRLRRLEQVGPVTFCVLSGPEDIPPAMDVLIRQKSRRHVETGGRDPYAATPALRLFYERLALLGPSGPRGVVCTMTVGETVVATEWGFVFAKRFLDILPAYEAGTWSRYSPGLVMKRELIRWCIDQGLDVFDLTVGDELYKTKWTESVLSVHALHRPMTLAGAVYWTAVQLRLAARRLLGPLRQKLRQRFQQRTQHGEAEPE